MIEILSSNLGVSNAQLNTISFEDNGERIYFVYNSELGYYDTISEDDIKGIYYKLLNYTKKFNKELSEDYEQIFIEHFNDVDDE